MIEIRRIKKSDYPSLIALQNDNLIGNLSDAQKEDGFLSFGWREEQFVEMDNDVCVIVGVEGDDVKAYLCASSVEFNLPAALPRAMIDRFPHVLFDDKPLTDWSVCITGPVCIDASLRGQGILEKLYDCLYRVAPPNSFDLAVVFVSIENPRSIKAHEKLGMQTLDQFEFNTRKYVIMAAKRSTG